MIFGFDGSASIYSNFSYSPFYYLKIKLPKDEFDAEYVPTLEHAFQAHKAKKISNAKKILNAKTPGLAKKMGRKVPLRDDWDEIKDDIMLHLVREKFIRNKYLLFTLLKTTGNIVYINEWHDNYWGNCTCRRCSKRIGFNKLGKILIQVRSELQGKYESIKFVY